MLTNHLDSRPPAILVQLFARPQHSRHHAQAVRGDCPPTFSVLIFSFMIMLADTRGFALKIVSFVKLTSRCTPYLSRHTHCQYAGIWLSTDESQLAS
ncbi:hypothetical protein BDR03DRAFT_971923 [Suillus americanus]|nr:hypothetical protein BDR03DRAFT_971923 [Suillus americanus]